jgi:PKD repeat protein
MKRICFILLFTGGLIQTLSAAHIRGGELYYKYLGPGNGNSSRYQLTLKLYIDCGQNNEGQLDTRAALTIFSKPGNQMVDMRFAPMVSEEFIRYDPASNPCITNPPLDVCYRLRYYQVDVELKNIPEGYTIAFQRCCRIVGIRNVMAPSNDVGATYLCEIPGTKYMVDAPKNSSPLFSPKDAVAICVGTRFNFDFSAKDPNDNDSLVYELCSAYIGGGPVKGDNCLNCPVPIPGAPPPYNMITYSSGYSGSNPLGNKVTLNRFTGILSGIAPPLLGQYVVTVCVSEYRNKILINTHRKDIHIKVSDCLPLRAKLNPDYSFCDDFLVTFRNEQINPTGSEYTWDFGDGTPVQTSSIPDGTLDHKYADTGAYRVKLKVVLAGQCIDSAQTIAKVYPGFFPGFTYVGACQFAPFNFLDTTKSRYGFPAFWHWNFGDETTDADTSLIKNPKWNYNSLGSKDVELIVASNKGCVDTVHVTVEVKDKPQMTLPFKDTLICSKDSLQLKAVGGGVFEWSPAYNIINPASANPVVYPKRTTQYTVKMTENSCVASDVINVRVVDRVSLLAGNDTTICSTDTIQLLPISDGLRFTWTATPAAPFSSSTEKNPFTTPPGNTNYHVIAYIGSCFTEDGLNVNTVPYPIANAGPDTTICFDDTAGLSGATNGSSFRWDPPVRLIGGNTLAPFAHPLTTTTYTLFGYDTLGCPKPGFDRVVVNVRPQIIPFAGNDTAIVKNQPLQLNASGSDFFEWTPPFGLNQSNISNPVAVLQRNARYIMKTYNLQGCFDIDTINIQVFQTMPDIFVPNAFVPNGKNNELRPKAVGISILDYFRVFNRWGQMVFNTTQFNKGWDGRINGILQDNGTYVWMISGTDYTGKKVVRKGTAVLIR